MDQDFYFQKLTKNTEVKHKKKVKQYNLHVVSQLKTCMNDKTQIEYFSKNINIDVVDVKVSKFVS